MGTGYSKAVSFVCKYGQDGLLSRSLGIGHPAPLTSGEKKKVSEKEGRKGIAKDPHFLQEPQRKIGRWSWVTGQYAALCGPAGSIAPKFQKRPWLQVQSCEVLSHRMLGGDGGVQMDVPGIIYLKEELVD